MDEHIVVREGEQYASVINDTKAIGEEVNISYTVKIKADNMFMEQTAACRCGTCVLIQSHSSSLSAQVAKIGVDVVTPPLNLIVTYPHKSRRQNNLLYLTHVATSPEV